MDLRLLSWYLFVLGNATTLSSATLRRTVIDHDSEVSNDQTSTSSMEHSHKSPLWTADQKTNKTQRNLKRKPSSTTTATRVSYA